MTGLHAVHLTIGVGVLAWLWRHARRFNAAYHAPVELSGLYWHFVDIVWVFLYPMFYLLERYSACQPVEVLARRLVYVRSAV